MFSISGWACYERATCTKQPQIRDVWELKSDYKRHHVTCYFLKLNSIRGDSFTFIRNHLLYIISGLQLDAEDFLDATDTVAISRNTFIEM